MCGCGWSKVWLAVVVGMGVMSATSAAVAQVDPATSSAPEAIAPTASSTTTAVDEDMPGAPRLAPTAPAASKEPTTARAPLQPPPGSTSGPHEPSPPSPPSRPRTPPKTPAPSPSPGPTVGATPAGTMPLEAIHRPTVLPPGLFAVQLASTAQVYSIDLTTFSLVPSLAVGLGRGFDIALMGPGVRWSDVPEGWSARTEPTDPVLAVDYELHRDVVEVVLGTAFRPPLFEPYGWGASLDVRMRAPVTPWLELAIGAEATAYDRGPALDLGTQAEGTANAAVRAQLGARVMASLATALVFDEFTRSIGRGSVVPQQTTELAVTVPLALGLEVALGDDHAWGVVGLRVLFPRLVSTIDDAEFRWTTLRYHTLWLGLYI